MKLSLLRHGEALGGRIYRGTQNDALTDLGWQQMLDATHRKSWDGVFTSPLIRCQKFASHLSLQQKIPLTLIKDFSEIGFGDWQGLSAATIGQNLVDKFKQDPINNPPPNAQNLYQFQQRVLLALENITAQNHQSLLIVAHAGVIRVIKSHLLNLPLEKMFTLEVANGVCENFEI
jgi:alpha-ribazole phosphatase/probable phosphoglycerate mutase